jgi:hypothetical protein
LNPVSTFVIDATTTVILLLGSRKTRKWEFLRQVFLPFIANELYANQLLDKESTVVGFFDAHVALSAFEITENETIIDLLRPSARGASVSFSVEDGINMGGIQKVIII